MVAVTPTVAANAPIQQYGVATTSPAALQLFTSDRIPSRCVTAIKTMSLVPMLQMMTIVRLDSRHKERIDCHNPDEPDTDQPC